MTHPQNGQSPNNVRHGLRGRPPLPPLKYENLVDEEVKGGDDDTHEGRVAEEDVGMFGRFFGGMRAAVDSMFGWCSDRDDAEVLDIERASAESLMRFKALFNENFRRLSDN